MGTPEATPTVILSQTDVRNKRLAQVNIHVMASIEVTTINATIVLQNGNGNLSQNIVRTFKMRCKHHLWMYKEY